MNVVSLLKKHGLKVVDKRVSPAPGEFHPVGVVVHHTAGTDSLNICRFGRSDLPGPLCNVLIDRHGTCWVVTDGKANDSGSGSTVVLNRVKKDRAPLGDAAKVGLRDDISGNPWFYDIEVENLGNGQKYTRPQLKALVKVAAAFCWQGGWSHNRVIHHREWTGRKIDMSYRGPLRRRVKFRLMLLSYRSWLRDV